MRAPLLHSASAPTLAVLFRHLVQVQEIEALKTVAHEAPHGWALRQVPDCRALYQALDSQALYKPLICRDLALYCYVLQSVRLPSRRCRCSQDDVPLVPKHELLVTS